MQLILRVWRKPLVVIGLLWFLGLVVWLVAFFTSALAAAGAEGDQSFPRSLLGVPILEAYQLDGGHGMDLHWGSAALLVAPVVVGAVAALDKWRKGAWA